MANNPDVSFGALNPLDTAYMQVHDSTGEVLFAGSFFNKSEFSGFEEGFRDETVNNHDYRIINGSANINGDTMLFQMAERKRVESYELEQKILLLLLGGLGISILTVIFGYFFSGTALKPARDTLLRLEQFTQDAAHELKTPLSAAGLSIDLAAKSSDYNRHLPNAKAELKNVNSIIDRLLELARLDKLSLNTKRADLVKSLKSVTQTLRPLLEEKNIEVKIESPAEIYKRVDIELFERLVANLLTNAIKYSKENSRITVELSRHHLIVIDTGQGISQADQRFIFDRFFQSDRSRSKEGLGIGLSLVRKIADLHDWTVRVKSELGNGAQFIVNF
jgi:hypothetical protein